MKVVTLDEAMNRTLVRPMPLNIAMPASFKLFSDEPYHGNYMWTTQKSYDALQTKGTSDRDEGLIQLRISLDIGYDRRTDAFICGPGCGENEIVGRMTESGVIVLVNERKSVNGVPVWFIEAQLPDGSSTAYLAYLATLIETNAVVLTWGPPQNDAESGKRVWVAMKTALLTSPPDPGWQAATNRPPRKTPPITMLTKIPAATERVVACIEAATNAAHRLNYKVDARRASEGVLFVTSDDADPVTLTLRFVDFGAEILLVSSAKASGNAVDKMVPVQRAYYAALGGELNARYPVVPVEDMSEQLLLLPRD